VRREGDRAVAEVADDGLAIPPAELERAFDPLSCLRAGGRLGLPVARELIARHGGEVSLRSGEGGSTFTVRLPAAEAPAGRP
jgi:signal transduction histidine kinase